MIDAAGERVMIVTRASVVQVKLRLQYQLLLFMLSTTATATRWNQAFLINSIVLHFNVYTQSLCTGLQHSLLIVKSVVPY